MRELRVEYTGLSAQLMREHCGVASPTALAPQLRARMLAPPGQKVAACSSEDPRCSK